ncbi:hypothetical protein BKA66DRAFT_444689 [Pyrenochaeta sp. MPI-SDFR-AT-0127]|nr:hypothetical protein BKA66DRAFT_444689 [Pyrenochaeta sp. MPI-SDFR-AT-0127]
MLIPSRLAPSVADNEGAIGRSKGQTNSALYPWALGSRVKFQEYARQRADDANDACGCILAPAASKAPPANRAAKQTFTHLAIHGRALGADQQIPGIRCLAWQTSCLAIAHSTASPSAPHSPACSFSCRPTTAWRLGEWSQTTHGMGEPARNSRT